MTNEIFVERKRICPLITFEVPFKEEKQYDCDDLGNWFISSSSKEERIFLANKPPFGEYQVGDFLGINVEILRWQASFANSKVWDLDDKDVVSKVIVKPPQFYLKQNIFNSEEFGDGWVEE